MALHGDYDDAQITDAIEQAVQCRLVELSADDSLVISTGFYLQPLEPTQPAFIENSLETDLIMSGSIRRFHSVFIFKSSVLYKCRIKFNIFMLLSGISVNRLTGARANCSGQGVAFLFHVHHGGDE